MQTLDFEMLDTLLDKFTWGSRELPVGVRRVTAWEFVEAPIEGFGSYAISIINRNGVEKLFGEVKADTKKKPASKSKGKKKADMKIPDETFSEVVVMPEPEPEPEPEAPETPPEEQENE